MRKLVIFIIIAAAAAFWLKNFVQGGQFEKYLDAHRNPQVNPAVEYYWGMLLDFTGHKRSAVYRLSKVVEKYPKSEYAPLAWAESIQVLDDLGDRGKVLEESKKFLNSDYACHPKAEIIKRKIEFIEHGY